MTVQLTGHVKLQELGYELIPVDAPNHFLDDTPTAVMVRQIIGSISQFEKSMVVFKPKAARDRKRKEQGKCERRKSYKELNPELVREARRLRRRNPVSGKQKSYDRVARKLFEAGYARAKITVFVATQLKCICA